jgi:hypothetical protein
LSNSTGFWLPLTHRLTWYDHSFSSTRVNFPGVSGAIWLYFPWEIVAHPPSAL